MKLKALIVAGLFLTLTGRGLAATSTWIGAVNSSFTTAGNWNNTTVPTDNAVFDASTNHYVYIDNSISPSVNSLTFNAGAPSYHLAIQALDVLGAGVINNSVSSQALSTSGLGARLEFWNSSSMGNANIESQQGGVTYLFNTSSAAVAHITTDLGGSLWFRDQSTAANSTVVNTGTTIFFDTATAGQAQLTASGGAIAFDNITTADHANIRVQNEIYTGQLIFSNSSSADHSHIYNDNGNIVFYDSSTGGQAYLNNSSTGTYSYVNISLISGSSLTIGSIAGGGYFYLGSKTLQTGGNGADTEVNGLIEGDSASLVKVGTGTMTLSGLNTYTGSTTINGGILKTGISNTLPASSALYLADASGVALDLNGNNQTIAALSGGGNTGGNVLLGSATLTVGGDNSSTTFGGIISGLNGALLKTGNGTLAITGANTYSGGTIVQGGILRVSNDNNLGAAGSLLSLKDGVTLQTTSGISSTRPVSLTGTVTFDAQNVNSNFSGQISGGGSLNKVGAGIMTIAGANNYTGGTNLFGGTLRAGASGVLPEGRPVSLANTSGVLLDLNNFSQSIGALSGGGALGGNINLGNASLTTGSDNTDTTYSGAISGSGSLNKTGTGTLTLSGDNVFTGDTTIATGAIYLPGSLPGNVRVNESTFLSGTGRTGALLNKGTVTPGADGSGSMTAASYSGTGTLMIDLYASSSTSLSVSGLADVTGGNLSLRLNNTRDGRYSVVTAGSVQGTFASLSPESSIFRIILPIYTSTQVVVTVNYTGNTFAKFAESRNQKVVADILDKYRSDISVPIARIIDSFLSMTAISQAQQGYTQISGDSLAGFQGTGLTAANVFTGQMASRGTSGAALSVAELATPAHPIQLAYAGDAEALGLGPQARSDRQAKSYGLWSRGLGFFDKVDADASLGSPASKATTGGFQMGYDVPMSDELLVGLSGGYAKTSLTVDDRSSSGNSTSIQSGVYASYEPGSWFVKGSLAYTTADNDMSRPIQFTGVNETASASFQSRVYSGLVEGGYRYRPQANTDLEPSVSLKGSHLKQDAFTESGAPGLNLDVQEHTVNSVVSAVGGRIAERFGSRTRHPVTIGAKAAWEHELGNIENSITASFAEAPAGGTFTVQGTPRSRNAAALGLDGNMTLTQSLSAFADYSVTLGSGQSQQAVFGRMRVTW